MELQWQFGANAKPSVDLQTLPWTYKPFRGHTNPSVRVWEAVCWKNVNPLSYCNGGGSSWIS
ncbi:MAG: hypothetical protein PHS59_03390 [Paludibacter sp.]|nr:hypothetical protein [Paludibacter sp.]